MTSPARRNSFAWLVLLFMAQAASLSLIESGRTPKWQHWDFARFTQLGRYGWSVAVLVVQLVAVARGMREEWRGIFLWMKERFRLTLLIVALGIFSLSAASPSRDIPQYGAELLLALVVQLVALGNVFLVVRALSTNPHESAWARFDRWLGDGGAPVRAPFLDRVALTAALGVFVITLALAVFVYQRVPHVPDELVYLVHARYFAAGKLVLPPPPSATAFDLDLMYYDPTRWFSPVPPGWPAILAIGVRLGIPWLVNPLLSALCVLMAHALLARIDSIRTARLTTILLATSPWFLSLGMGLMTHQATIASSLAAALGIEATRRRGALMPALGAGVAIGIVGLIRPLEGVVVALVLGVWSLWSAHRLFRLLPSVVLTASTAVTSALVAPYDVFLTGKASRFPIMMYSDKYYGPGANDMGFGPNRGMGWVGLDPFPGHGFRDVVVNSLLNSSAMSAELFGWMCGSLLLLLAMLAARRLRGLDWSMFGIIAFVVGVHAFYWFSGGPDFGARYWYLVLIPCVVLTARAPQILFAADGGRMRASSAAVLLSLGGLLLFLPWRAAEKFWRYRKMTPDAREFVAAHPLGNALVLVRGRHHPDYEETALENPLDLRASGTVFAWDRSRQVRAEVVAEYPDRPVYFIDGPTITGGGFRIVAGPLPPGSLNASLPSSEELPIVNDIRYDGVKKRTP